MSTPPSRSAPSSTVPPAMYSAGCTVAPDSAKTLWPVATGISGLDTSGVADGVADGVLDGVGATGGTAGAVGLVVGAALSVGLGLDVADSLGMGVPAGKNVWVNDAVQVTSEPPAAEPLHCLIVTGSAVLCVDGSTTLQVTRLLSPPPLAEPLHWVMVASLVVPSGEQFRVGSVPPPVPEPLHWLRVAGARVVDPMIVFTTVTVQSTVAPPPRPEPLHWSMAVVLVGKVTGSTVQSGSAPAAAVQVRVTMTDFDS